MLAEHGKTLDALKWEQEQILKILSRQGTEQQQQGKKLDSILGTVAALKTRVYNLEREAK